MIINIITIGKNMPHWITAGFHEYAKRLPQDFQLNLIEISAMQQVKQKQGERMLAAIPKNSYTIALDEHGKQWSTYELAKQLQNWRENWQQVSLLVGGAEGLSTSCLEKAQIKWSLSSLTLPHPLVRVIVAEQLYRAWSILSKHPYHRG